MNRCNPIVSAIVMLALLQAPLRAVCQVVDGTSGHVTFWATADSLMPAWGFYPLAQSYGETKPIGQWAAWCAAGNDGQLTWVAEFPRDGEYQVWIRKYGGYGKVAVLVNERPVSGGMGGPGGGRYVWNHVGHIAVSKGRHHVDLAVSKGMFDVVLFTTNDDLNPAEDALPKPVEQPTPRGLRSYRDDARWRRGSDEHGFVVGRATAYQETLYDWLPDKSGQDQLDRLRLWGAAGQYINGTFAMRAVKDLGELTVSLDQLTGPDNTTIRSSEIGVRVVHVRERKNSLFRTSRTRLLVPELLLRDDRTGLPPKGKQGGFGGGRCVTGIPAHQSRQVWITVHVSTGSPPGVYRGEVSIVGENSSRQLPVELELLPITLQPAEGYYAIYHRTQPTDPDQPHFVSPERYLAELRDHVRHGLNAATLYGGFSTLDLARRAGMSKAPCLMHWPGGDAKEQVTAAKKMGFEDLYYYGVDEPNKPEQIERCRKEAERRQQAGLHMFTAINSKSAQTATRDFIDRPVYNIYVFGGRNNAEAMYVRERGFLPISYWVTATTYPLPYRALTGLYNKACGYQGSSPWAYQDYADNRLYDPDKPAHKVAYPDEYGRPIPTLAWEAHRAGIDDVRYLEALDRAIAAARKRLKQPAPSRELSVAFDEALRVRKQDFESIDGRWFEYLCRIRPGDLEKTRRSLADVTVRLNQALEK
jgi:hypothetical protein